MAVEGALWRTLKLLLFKPGQLTREYLAGRRRRYVLPLRIYLTASFLFFLIVKLLPSAVDEAALESAARLPARAAAEAIRESAASAAAPAHEPALVLLHETGCTAASAPPCNAFERTIHRIGERFRSDPRRFVEHMKSRFSASVPYAVFLLLPASGSDLVLLAAPVHSALALRTVYGGGWAPTLARTLFIGVLYGLLLLLATLGLVAVLLAFA
ncbi:MAG: DUF3667 domain-containing protein [Pseudomonadota bacterium]